MSFYTRVMTMTALLTVLTDALLIGAAAIADPVYNRPYINNLESGPYQAGHDTRTIPAAGRPARLNLPVAVPQTELPPPPSPALAAAAAGVRQ